MAAALFPLLPLADFMPGQEADCFALLTAKELLTTRDHKPYYKVTFRDARREVSFPLWADSAFYANCRDHWQPGMHYKLRATYKETAYGPQLDIQKLRPVTDKDRQDGFDPWMCIPRSRFNSERMFAELCDLVREKVTTPALRDLTLALLQRHQTALLALPAATKNHHAYVGGFLEHVVSVTRTAVYLAEKYDAYYSELIPRLRVELVVAGAVLHDIGKLQEIELTPQGAQYTSAGALIGHMVQGRDLVRDAAVEFSLPADLQLRLEHIILSHQRLPEWGSPKPPMTPEAYLVHYADDIDAKMNMLAEALSNPAETGPLTSKKNRLFQQLYKGPGPDSGAAPDASLLDLPTVE
ncbi:MAG: HD domain-containing protein [Pirellulales bacterium]|nr:HD domain-containing protein [Pirellulales bacterium]